MKRRRPLRPTHHLKSATRQIDQIGWKLHDEQLAAYIAYILAVSRGEKREIRKLFRAEFAAFLGSFCGPGTEALAERKASSLTAYEGKMAALHDVAKRLQSQMEGRVPAAKEIQARCGG